MLEQAGTKLQHYKGGIYTVIGRATHWETGADVLVYQNDEDKKIWVRPIQMFYETIDNDYYFGKVFKVIE